MREVQRDAADAEANQQNGDPDNDDDANDDDDANGDDDANDNEPDEPNNNNNEANVIDPNKVTTDAAKTTDEAEPNNDDTDKGSEGKDNNEPNLDQHIESDNNADAEPDSNDAEQVRRSSCVSKPVSWYEPSMNNRDYNESNFITQVLHHASYDTKFVLMMAKIIMHC